MNDPLPILHEIRERLVRIEERAEARDHRLLAVEATVERLQAFRWWIVGSIGAAGGVGGIVSGEIFK